jgi:hypothetical protein
MTHGGISDGICKNTSTRRLKLMFPHFTDSTADLSSLLLGIAFVEYEGSNESYAMMLAQLKSTCVLVDTSPYYLTFFFFFSVLGWFGLAGTFSAWLPGTCGTFWR